MGSTQHTLTDTERLVRWERLVKFSQCEIWVQGDVDDDLMDALPQFTVRERDARTTVLRGRLRDQSELHGVLQILDQLGVELVEVRTSE